MPGSSKRVSFRRTSKRKKNSRHSSKVWPWMPRRKSTMMKLLPMPQSSSSRKHFLIASRRFLHLPSLALTFSGSPALLSRTSMIRTEHYHSLVRFLTWHRLLRCTLPCKRSITIRHRKISLNVLNTWRARFCLRMWHWSKPLNSWRSAVRTRSSWRLLQSEASPTKRPKCLKN